MTQVDRSGDIAAGAGASANAVAKATIANALTQGTAVVLGLQDHQLARRGGQCGGAGVSEAMGPSLQASGMEPAGAGRWCASPPAWPRPSLGWAGGDSADCGECLWAGVGDECGGERGSVPAAPSSKRIPIEKRAKRLCRNRRIA